MKIKTNAKALSKALGEMAPFSKAEKESGRRTAFIETGVGAIVVKASDFDANFYGERVVDATVVDPGKAAVCLNSLINALSVCSNDDIELDLSDTNGGALVSGRSELRIPGSMNKPWNIKSPTQGWMSINQTATMIEAATIANKCRRQDDDTRYLINSICMAPEENGLSFIGTDRVMLVATSTDVKLDLNEPVLCHPAITLALSSFDKNDSAEINVEDKAVWVRQKGRVNVVPKFSGAFPHNFKVHLDPNPNYMGVINTKEAKRAITAVTKKVVNPDYKDMISISFSNNEMKITGQSKNSFLSIDKNGEGELEPRKVAASRLVRALSLFDGDFKIAIGTMPNSKEKVEHIYLTDEHIFAMIRLF
jgi:DNA polymerase III sliding clamp (beta) subunit (PCNA family)